MHLPCVGPEGKYVGKWLSKYVSDKFVKCQNKNSPLPFQARCHRRWLNLALVCVFCVVVHLFWLANAWFCCVRFGFSIPSQEIGLENVSEMTYFVLSGTCSLNSVSQPPCTLILLAIRHVLCTFSKVLYVKNRYATEDNSSDWGWWCNGPRTVWIWWQAVGWWNSKGV